MHLKHYARIMLQPSSLVLRGTSPRSRALALGADLNVGDIGLVFRIATVAGDSEFDGLACVHHRRRMTVLCDLNSRSRGSKGFPHMYASLFGDSIYYWLIFKTSRAKN